MNNILSDNDIKQVYNLATYIYRKNKFVEGVDCDDFRQICAIAAVNNAHKIAHYNTLSNYFRAIVNYKLKAYCNSKKNIINCQ